MSHTPTLKTPLVHRGGGIVIDARGRDVIVTYGTPGKDYVVTESEAYANVVVSRVNALEGWTDPADVGEVVRALRAFVEWDDAEGAENRNHSQCMYLYDQAIGLARAALERAP